MSKLLDQAKDLATQYHSNQKRKFLNTPYINHPIGVVELLKGWGVKNEKWLIVAYLHDMLEDTDVPHDLIKQLFGNSTYNHIKDLSHLDKEQQKADWLRNLAEKAKDYIVIIKMADRIHNVYDFIKSGKADYALKYWNKATSLVNRLHRMQINRTIISNIFKSISELESVLKDTNIRKISRFLVH